MTKLNYNQKLTLLAHNENTLALWFRNALSIISLNMLFILLFKNYNKYLFLILPLISILFLLFTTYNYNKKHTSILNNTINEEIEIYYIIGIYNIFFLIIIACIVLIVIILYYNKYI
tara:strand:+ start:408 stop:758 length:351 start_codon:yes stop_codon:yes gene_type:complete